MASERRYTANIHNTGSLIDESKTVLRLFSKYKDEQKVKQVLLEDNPLNKESEGTIEKIFFITRKRYLRKNPWPLIKMLESDLPSQTVDAVMFYYFAKSDNLVYDLTTDLLFDLYLEGNLTVTKNDVEEYLKSKEEDHPEISDWSITTRNKTIRHYLAAVKDFGILQGSKKKEFADYHLPTDAFFYVFYYLLDSEDQKESAIAENRDWKLYLMEKDSIETSLSEGTRRGYIGYESAGNITNIETTYDSLEEYVNDIT